MVQEVFFVDQNLKMILLFDVPRQTSSKFPTMYEITHSNGKRVGHLFPSDNLAALRLFSENVYHSSLRPAIINHLDRDYFSHLSILHIDNLEQALFDLTIEKVLVSVSQDSIELLWASSDLLIGYIIYTQI